MKKRVSVVFGTRPEAIKLAPVILALRQDDRFDCGVCVTGQHRQMLDQALEAFDINPDVDLNLMTADQTLAELTASLVRATDRYYAAAEPDLVLVQGDTTTTFCATLTAFYRRVPVGHVEAGLRTGSLDAPWPEEANRVLTSRLVSLHFAPTETSRENLLRELTPASSIHVTGNTIVDALLLARDRARKLRPSIPGLAGDLVYGSERRLVLVTGHRRESFGPGFESICRALATLADSFPETAFVYPVHLNPNVREPVKRILGAPPRPNLHLIEPLSYLAFVALMERSSLILTDSGGIQEEAPTLGKPVLVMRDTTERPEGVRLGMVRLVGTSQSAIIDAVEEVLSGSRSLLAGESTPSPYGDGRAAGRIRDACAAFLHLESGHAG